MADELRISPFAREFQRDSFDCGEESLDRYLRQGVGQDARRQLAVCYVLHMEDSREIIGFYTLSALGQKSVRHCQYLRTTLPGTTHLGCH